MQCKFYISVLTFNISLIFLCLSISNVQTSNDFPYFCDLNISFYPGFDGEAYEKFHSTTNSVRGKTTIFHGEHPSHGPYEQLGVKLIADVCLKNENSGQVYVDNPEDPWIKNSDINVEKHEYSLTDFILIFLDDEKSNEENDDCKDKWWTSFEENKRVIIKVADVWQGMTAHYSTAYAIAPKDIMMNGKWICS